RRFRAMERLGKFRHLFRVWVVHVTQLAAGFDQAVALSVDVAVVQPDRRKREIAGPAHGVRFALRGVIHSIRFLHGAMIGNMYAPGKHAMRSSVWLRSLVVG